jgi:hypothetical protein
VKVTSVSTRMKQMRNEDTIITIGMFILLAMILVYCFGCDKDETEPDAGQSCFTHVNESCPDANSEFVSLDAGND